MAISDVSAQPVHPDAGPLQVPGGEHRVTAASGDDQDRVRLLEQKVWQLSRAVRSRDVIGQAKGVLIGHYGISADAAFRVLVRLSQHTNTKLAEIAPALVDRLRERGPAEPARCRVLTSVIESLLAESLVHPACDTGVGGNRNREDTRHDHQPGPSRPVDHQHLA
jgi:hypothetical protein